MNPYYEDDAVTIYHGDSREIEDVIQADVMLTDPPYSLSVETDHTNKPGRGTRRLNFFDGDTDWDTMTDEIVQVVAHMKIDVFAAYVWCGHRQFGPLVERFERDGWKTRPLVWRKACPVPAPPGVGWDSAVELCVYAFRAGRAWLPPTGTKVPNVIDADSYRHGQPGKVAHPTQKPIVTAALPIMPNQRHRFGPIHGLRHDAGRRKESWPQSHRHRNRRTLLRDRGPAVFAGCAGAVTLAGRTRNTGRG